jgi:hypothetical protein
MFIASKPEIASSPCTFSGAIPAELNALSSQASHPCKVSHWLPKGTNLGQLYLNTHDRKLEKVPIEQFQYET